MALRKLYTVVAITTYRHRISDVIRGFTLARSDDEAERIVELHTGRGKKVDIYMLSGGTPKQPIEARLIATYLLEYGFDWLDPRGPSHRHSAPNVPALVVQLMQQDAAL